MIALSLALLCEGRAWGQVVAFGASNISGWNVAATEAIPAQLQAMLREKGYRVSVANAGIYGNTTAEMRARMDRDIPQGTILVVLDMTGGLFNDGQHGISCEQGEADLAAIQAHLTERGIKVVPVSAASLPTEMHQADGVHLTPEGHRQAAAALLPQVLEALGPPPPALSVREACIADARRLCADVLGDESKRHQCMQEHRAQLSKDCLRAIAESRQRHEN